MPQTIIQALREWLSLCPLLGVMAADVNVDWLEENPTDHGIFPAGQTQLGEDMYGAKIWQYDALIAVSEFSIGNINRLENCGFMESFHAWINGYSRNGFSLPEGCDFITVRAGNGMMDNISEDGQRGRYTIMVNLTYERMM